MQAQDSQVKIMKRRTQNAIPDWSHPGLTMTIPPSIHHGRGGMNTTDAKYVFNIQMQNDFTIGTWNVRTLYAH